jgi:hypothetical protein
MMKHAYWNASFFFSISYIFLASPTTKNGLDANPFERQSPDDRMKFFAFGGVVIDIVASPLGTGWRERPRNCLAYRCG